MIDTEAFREFKQALTFLRDNYPIKALPHMRRAVELDTHNPYYRSYLGVVVARAERKWAEAEELCDTAEIGRAHSELQSRQYLVCRLLLEKKKTSSPHAAAR